MVPAHAYRSPVALVVGLVLASVAPAADLHFIAFIDTNDPMIGTVEDFQNALAWADLLASSTGLTLRLQAYSGGDVSISRTRNVLTSLQVSTDDVVYFYYSGHGYNPGDRRWPILTYVNTLSGTDVSLDEVVETLIPKQPRLLIILADCCNSYPDGVGQSLRLPSTLSATQQANFRRLLCDFRGSVLACGASPGQVSLGGAGEGSLFTNYLMYDMVTLAASTTELTWAAVLGQTKTDTQTEAATIILEGETAPVVQVPQYAISISKIAAQTAADLQVDPNDNHTGSGLLGGTVGTTSTGTGTTGSGSGSGTTGGTSGGSGTTDTGTTPTQTDTPTATTTWGLCGPIGVGPLLLIAAGFVVMGRGRRR